jgi:hypothetical protein
MQSFWPLERPVQVVQIVQPLFSVHAVQIHQGTRIGDDLTAL